MKATTISKGGQVSIPAEIRRRWRTQRLLVEDHGDALVFRPIPADPIGAAIGSLAGAEPDSEQLLSRAREEEALSDELKWGKR